MDKKLKDLRKIMYEKSENISKELEIIKRT